MAVPYGIKVDDIVTCIAPVKNNLGEEFDAGTTFIVDEVDGEDYMSLHPEWELDGVGIWFYFYRQTEGSVCGDSSGRFVINN